MLTRQNRGVQEEDLFGAALALPASERVAYLKRACDSEPGLFERLTSLIDDFSRATAFVGQDAIRAWDSVDHIGPYRLLRELGEGGCGVAYLAEQRVPVRREVAIKVIKPGMDTKTVVARFEAERQALALMDHPNVARVFDAGATDEGRPYFVMELVRGIRITEYCDQSRLAISERLLLFIQVCQAIQHAHQKGIIHRDIKPSNVLVTMHDGSPIAKVIDFGIAKATRGRLTDQTLHTEVDQIMGTPAYLSPEQAEAGQVAVDTRSDIYSLGALLYELLTGQPPFDPHELAEASIEQLRERLRTERPPRPSQRFADLDGELLTKVSDANGATPAKLEKQVRDELDWIVMRCLEKEPPRRYQAVTELIADVDRYLRDEPVLARPPSLTYTAWKFARRNRVVVFTALVFVLFITTLAVTMTVQAQRIAAERNLAERERQRAEKVSNVMVNIFALADPFLSPGTDVSRPALLDQAAKSLERELTGELGPPARLLQALGLAYLRIGQTEAGTRYLREAIRTSQQTGAEPNDVMVAIINLSWGLCNTDHVLAAQEALDNAEEIAKRYRLYHSTAYAKLLGYRGCIELHEGRIPAAQDYFHQSLQLYQAILQKPDADVAGILSKLSVTLTWSDDLSGAEQTVRQAIEIFDSTVSPLHPDRVSADLTLAQTLHLQGRLQESASMLETALNKSMVTFGPNSVQVVDALDSLAVVKYSEGKLSEAEEYSRSALATARNSYGARHPATANTAITLGRTLCELRKYREAEVRLREGLDIFSDTLPPDHQYVASAEYFLGEVLLSTNRLTEAESVLTASMNRWKRGDAPPWRAMRSANALGEAIYRQGRKAEGEKYLSESLRELSADPKADREAKDKAAARAKRYLQTASASR